MHPLTLFSVLYLILASVSPIMGYYALRLNPKDALNRLFMLICLCLMLWALGFSVIVVAPDSASAAIWLRVSSVGFELIYSLLLHFTLVLTGRRNLLRKKWFLLLLYLPAAVCLYAFVISPDVARAIYLFENTARGWVRTTPSTVYDLFFKIYFAVAVLGSLALLARWGFRNADAAIRNQARALILSFLAAFGVGTLTDIVNGELIHLPIPQMAPVLFILPLYAISHCIRRYHLLMPRHVNQLELILDDERRLTVFKFLSYGLIAGGILLFVIAAPRLIPGGGIPLAVPCALMAALGAGLYAARALEKPFAAMEALLVTANLTLVPVLTVSLAPLGGTTVWALPAMLIVCALVFNSDILLLSAALPALLSQAYLAGAAPLKTVSADIRTYAARAAILLFIVAAAYVVHRIYVGRLRENAAQTRMQTLIGDIASGFSLTGKENAAQRIHSLLERLAAYFMAETVLIHAVEGEFAELIGTQLHSAGGGELSPQLMGLCMERWTAFRHGGDAFPETPPDSARAPEDRRPRPGPAPGVFVPIYEQEEPTAFIYIETPPAVALWTREQPTLVPVISRIVSDALQKLQSEIHITFMAYYDSLTKLPNRQLFHDRAEQAIHLARRNNRSVGIVFLDLDSFKSINDTMGHEGGDLLIQLIGRRLSEALRKSDTVARFGGDEFLILLNSIADVDDIAKVADKIMGIFKEPISLRDQEIFITASAGIAVFPADGEDAQTLIKHADIAMYTAKDRGKNRYAFCSSNMKEAVRYRVSLSNNLYRALERGEFQVYYQPQIDLRTERISGLEALLRWIHPEYGMIPPLEFIALAEQTGLINPIGSWVLETACAQVVAFKQAGLGDLRIAVNLSVIQLRNPGLTAQVEQILKKTGIDPAMVELEITESTTIKEPDYIIRVLNDLKALGVGISIDDFGTEYSSLNRLKVLPVDRLKMDIQFVQGITKSPKDRAISLVIMNLAKSLDLKLVAEGVETAVQLDFLKNRMCDEVQGFYYYKPMPAEEIGRILRE